MEILTKYWYLTRVRLVKKKKKKHFIGYLYDDELKPLHIMLPRTSAYVTNYDGQAKWVYILI